MALIPTLTVLGTYVAKINVQVQSQALAYSELITKALYQRSLNSDNGNHSVFQLLFFHKGLLWPLRAESKIGVIAYLLENCVQQEVKESLVGYFFLQQRGDMVCWTYCFVLFACSADVQLSLSCNPSEPS